MENWKKESGKRSFGGRKCFYGYQKSGETYGRRVHVSLECINFQSCLLISSVLFSDHEVDVFTKFSSSLDSAVKNMHKTAADQTQRFQTHFKREYQTVGKAFNQLGTALQQDGNYLNPNLNNAIICTGEAYEEIAKMFDDQPRNDWEPLGDIMHDYKGMLAGWPGILQIHAVRYMLHNIKLKTSKNRFYRERRAKNESLISCAEKAKLAKVKLRRSPFAQTLCHMLCWPKSILFTSNGSRT